MKKIIKVAACSLMAAMLVTGCSEKAEETTAAGAGAEAAATVAVEPVVEVVPDGQESVELGEYKGLEYVPVNYEVTDEDVELEIQGLLEANSTVVQVNRAAQEGDIVNIDYVGKKDGVAFDGGTAAGYDLKLGSDSFIDGFEDGLIGVEEGQTVNLDLTFPEVYHSEELAGQAVVFEVTVNSVKEEIPAVLSDSFVAQYTDYTTVEECREGMKKELQDYVDQLADNQKKNELWTQVIETTKVTVAESEVDSYFHDLYDGYAKEAEEMGMEMEVYVGYFGVDLETFTADMTRMAQEAIKNAAICRAIGEAEGMTITDEDRESLAEELGYGDAEVMISMTSEAIVDNYIWSEKVIEFIAENAVAVTAE